MKLSPHLCPRPGSANFKAIAARLKARKTGGPAAGAPDAAAASEDAYAARAAEHVAMLREMATVGMTLLQAVNRQTAGIAAQPQAEAPAADAQEPAPVTLGELGLAYSRITRAMRLTAVLELRLMGEARQRAAAPAAAAEYDGGFSELSAEQVANVRNRLFLLMTRKRAVMEVVRETLLDSVEDEAVVADCCQEISEQLIDHEKSAVLNHPISFTIARICQDLGITPDWDDWADTDWAREEILDAVPGSPYVPDGALPQRPPPWEREAPPPGPFSAEPDERSG